MLRRRLDEELVEQGFFTTSGEALRAVMAGQVSTANRRLDRPGERVEPGIELHVKQAATYVSRGGLKLAHALDVFGVDPQGLHCLDVGCSTGGFTHCLLDRGAASVCAVDVGYAQFSWNLRCDPRVTLFERTNILELPTLTSERFDLAVCDVSFTSVATVLPAVVEILDGKGDFLTLVKPQFEAAREEVDEGGIVHSQEVRLHTLTSVAKILARAGLEPVACCTSPITGRKGNIEYLLLGRFGATHMHLNFKRVVFYGECLTPSIKH